MIKRPCIFSPCGNYRYTLHRLWNPELPRLVVIGLNPSTADDANDDPTIRRCIDFARRWGCGSYTMLNLFAWRATDPAVMKAQADPVGEQNDAQILKEAHGAKIVLAAWGNHGAHRDRDLIVRRMLHSVCIPLVVLAINAGGAPKHPLYVKASTVPQPFAL